MGSTVGPSSTTSPGTRASRARAGGHGLDDRAEQRLASRSSRARAASMLARIAPDGLVVAVASMPASKRARPIRRVRASTMAPCENGGQRLVRAGHEGVGPGRDRVRRQRRVEPEVGAPRRVDDERDAVPVRHRRQARHVTDRADVGRVADEHRSGVRGAGEGRLEGGGGHPDGQAVVGVDLGPHPHRLEPGRARGRAASSGAACGPRRPGRRGGPRRARAPGCRGSSRRPRTGRGRRPRAGRPAPRPRRATPRASFIVSRPA